MYVPIYPVPIKYCSQDVEPFRLELTEKAKRLQEQNASKRGLIVPFYPGATFSIEITDPITGEITHRTKAMLRKYFVKWIETVPATQILTPVSTLPGILTSAHFIGNDGQVHDIAWLRFHYRDKLSELNDNPEAFEKWLLTEQHYRYYFR